MNHLTKILAATFFSFSVYSHNHSNPPPPYIETLQFRANDPIEDRIAHGKLNQVSAYVVSVFDGHGGYLTVNSL